MVKYKHTGWAAGFLMLPFCLVVASQDATVQPGAVGLLQKNRPGEAVQ